MDHPVNRREYLKEYSSFLAKLKLNEELKRLVRNFSPELWENEDPSDEAIKSFILLELTKRDPCSEVIKFLRQSYHSRTTPDNNQLAKFLEWFNTSWGRTKYGDEVDIWVPNAWPSDLKKVDSSKYGLTNRIRGKAIIINVVPELVKSEAERFAHIFKKLLFESKIYFELTTTQMKTLMNEIKENLESDNNDQALIVMIITHGGNEKIVGRNHPSCHPSGATNTDPEDIIPLNQIVNIFEEIKGKPFFTKMFFFTCCRHITEEKVNRSDLMFRTDTQTYIFYSCAEGSFTMVEPDLLYTFYGRRLSESFAQFANNKSLTEIINKTNLALQDDYKDNKSIGYHAPSNHQNCVTKSLHFNPGWYMNEAHEWQKIEE